MDDLTLVREAASGSEVAAGELLRRIADTVWSACLLACQGEHEARDACSDVLGTLQADGFARLRAYDGRSRIETFTALVTRDLLARRILALLDTDSEAGWMAFESFFRPDMRRIISRRLNGPQHQDARNDAYQDICLALVDNAYRRLKAYNGSGSFTGFVLHMVDRLAIDCMRGIIHRRRLPAAIARMGGLEQEIFRQVYWEDCPCDPDYLAPALVNRQPPPPPGRAEIAAALERVSASLPSGYEGARGGAARMVPLPETDDPIAEELATHDSPETIALHREEARRVDQAAAAIRRAEATLDDPERLYLKIALSGDQPLPARAVARLMGKPVEEVYKLKQRVMKQLRDSLEEHPAIKEWREFM